MILKLLMLFIFSVMLIWLRRTSANPKAKTYNNSLDNHAYHAVEVTASDDSCACAKEINGKRILSSEVNNRILQHCDVTNCTCHFRHFSDRRKGLDRRIRRLVYDPIHSSYGRRKEDIHNKARFRLARDRSTNQSLAGTV